MGLLAKFLPQGTFARGILALVSGTLGSQAILIASSPVLTRLFTPTDFGLLSVFLSMLGLVGSVAALRYELAIPLPDDDHSAVALAATGAAVVALLSAVLLVLVLTYSQPLASQFNAPSVAPFLWLLPAAFLANGLVLLLNMLCVRHARFDSMATAKVVQSVVTVLVQIIGFAFGGLALIIGRVLGLLAAAVHLILTVGKRDLTTARGLQARDLWQAAVTYRKFPLISTWAALASSIGSSVAPLLFASYFGLDMAGYFAMTMMVMVLPMSVIGVAVQNAFYRKAVDAHKAGALSELILAVQSRLVLAMMPVMALSAFILPQVFALVFGDAWRMSGSFAVWILPWMFFQITVTPSTGIFPIIDRLGTAFVFDLGLAIAPFAAFWGALWLDRDALTAVQILSALASLVYVARASVAFRLSGGKMVSGVAAVFRHAPIALLGVLPASVARVVWPDQPVSVLGLAVGAGLLLIAIATRWAWKRLPAMEPIPLRTGSASHALDPNPQNQ